MREHIAADDALWKDAVWSQVWVIRAKLARFEHDYDAAANALDIAAALAQPAYQGEAWLERGVLANYREDNQTAARCFAEGMTLARQFQNARLMAQLLRELGILALEQSGRDGTVLPGSVVLDREESIPGSQSVEGVGDIALF